MHKIKFFAGLAAVFIFAAFFVFSGFADSSENNPIWFKESETEYYFALSDVISSQQVSRSIGFDADVTYSIVKISGLKDEFAGSISEKLDSLGINIDESNGEVKLSDFDKLNAALMKCQGDLKLTVCAKSVIEEIVEIPKETETEFESETEPGSESETEGESDAEFESDVEEPKSGPESESNEEESGSESESEKESESESEKESETEIICETFTAEYVIIIHPDRTAPEISVTLSSSVNSENGVDYYNKDITVAVAVREFNFFAEDVKIEVSKVKKEEETAEYTYSPEISWSEGGDNTYIAVFALIEDASYSVSVSYTDKSGNFSEPYASGELVIDTGIEEPEFNICGEEVKDFAGVYAEDAEISLSFYDVNLNEYEVRIERQNLYSKQDVTKDFITVAADETEANAIFHIPKEEVNDGLYTLSVNVSDKAYNSVSCELTFTLNRFGSVYVYDDYLMSLIEGSGYIKIEDGNTSAITNDLIITEHSVCDLITDSSQIVIMRDGEVIDSNVKAASFEDFGHSYKYTIGRANFKKDGTYKILVISSYDTIDSGVKMSVSVPDNSVNEEGKSAGHSLVFTVDTAAPEFRNITDSSDSDTDTLKFSVIDAGGLSKIDVFIDEEKIDTISGEKFKENGGSIYMYSGSVEIEKKDEAQTIRLAAEDLAGNIAYASSEISKAKSEYKLFKSEDKTAAREDKETASFESAKSSSGSAIVIAALAVIFILAIVFISMFISKRIQKNKKR